MKKKGLDRDLIISFAALSLMAALGIIFFILFIFDINISLGNLSGIVGSFSGLSGSIWCILLCRNC